MSNIEKSNRNNIIGLIHDKDLDIIKPYERDIYLFETHIAGTSYVSEIDKLINELNIDDRLDFFREPNNPYDHRAIVIKTVNGIKIGYVPKDDNIIFSRLMDAGKLLFGKITAKEKKDSWNIIKIDIYLKE